MLIMIVGLPCFQQMFISGFNKLTLLFLNNYYLIFTNKNNNNF